MATLEDPAARRAAAPSVLLVCEWFAKYTATLGRGLQEHGADLTLLAREHELEFGGEPGALRRHLKDTLQPETPLLTLGGRVRDPRVAARLPALRRAVRSRSHDVLHVQDSIVNDPRLGVVAGLRPGRYAITVHDPVPHPGDRVPSWRIARTRRILRRYAGLVFVHAERLREELLATEPPRGPVVVVPHGMDAPRPAPLPKAPAALFFGRISRYKGLDVLLDAMPLAWRSLPDLRLIIAGQGALPDHPVLEDPRIDLRLGHVPEDELAELFAGSSCAVLPYRQASQSGVATQARQHGRAVIASGRRPARDSRRRGGPPRAAGGSSGAGRGPCRGAGHAGPRRAARRVEPEVGRVGELGACGRADACRLRRASGMAGRSSAPALHRPPRPTVAP